jgi:hypothetical protein
MEYSISSILKSASVLLIGPFEEEGLLEELSAIIGEFGFSLLV